MPLLLVLSILFLAARAEAQIFQNVGSVTVGFNNQTALADFDLDGRVDLAVGVSNTGQLTVAFGTSTGTFTAAPGTPSSIDTPSLMTTGDFDHDGRMDIAVFTTALVGESRVRVHLATGSSAFAARPPFLLSGAVRTAVSGDFTGDGNLDLAVVTAPPGGSSVLTVLRGNGKGEFSTPLLPQPIALPVPVQSIVDDAHTADFNSDGRLDLAMTVQHQGGAGLVIALADGFGSFTATAMIGNQAPAVGARSRLALADFTGDRIVDAVMFGYRQNEVTLWTNSAGVFTPQTQWSTPVALGLYDIAVSDFNLDGFMDWVVSRPTAGGSEIYVGVALGNGSFFLAPGSGFTVSGIFPLIEAGDFNGDRRPDLLVLQGNADSFRIMTNILTAAPTQQAQQIQFVRPADRGRQESPFTPAVSTTSGLPAALASLTPLVCTVAKNEVTLLALGSCTLIATQPGNLTFAAATPVQRTFTVAAVTQVITFADLPDRTLETRTFTLTASASSGLPVTFTASPANVCTVSGTTVTLLAVGQCSITANQAGDTQYPPAPPVTRTFTVNPIPPQGPRIESVVNAASYVAGTLAPSMYGAIFGLRFSSEPTVTMRDAAGTVRPLELIFKNQTQINFVVPAATALGQATLSMTTPSGAAEFGVTIAAVAPGLFSAAGTGQGLAAAQALIVNNDRSITTLTVGDGPIPVLSGTEIYLVLYGTGIRGRAPNSIVTATVGGRLAEVLYAGPQGFFPGLDQVNLKVPLTVGGVGLTSIQLIVAGQAANIVQVNFQ